MKGTTRVWQSGRWPQRVATLAGLATLVMSWGCSSGSSGGPTSPTGPSPANNVPSALYRGVLTLVVTNTFPEFTARSNQIDVTVSRDGTMTFATGWVNYNAEEVDGDIKIHRSGSMTINPVQAAPFPGPTGRIQILENTRVSEHLEVWIKQQGRWVKRVDEHPSAFWNGGLAFSRADAETAGARVSTDDVVVAGDSMMGSATWTLTLFAL